MYSSYQLILSFPHQLVILTTVGTPKNIFCFNNNIMNDSSKQDHPGKNKFVALYSQNYAAGIRGHYHESSDCFEYPKKSLLKSNHPKKILAKFSYPKKSGHQKFQTQKNPSIIPVT